MVSARWFEEEVMGQPSSARIVVVILEMCFEDGKGCGGKKQENFDLTCSYQSSWLLLTIV